MDIRFIDCLKSQLFYGNKNIRILRSAFGRSMKDDISIYLAFLSTVVYPMQLSQKDPLDIYFLISCLFFDIENINKNDNVEDMKYVKVEELFKRLYKTSGDTTKSEIMSFLDSSYSEKGYFIFLFKMLFDRAADRIKKDEKIDYVSLVKDIKTWNDSGSEVKKRWARRILKECDDGRSL